MELTLVFSLLLASTLAAQPKAGFNMGPWLAAQGFGREVGGRVVNGDNAVVGAHPYQVSYQRSPTGPGGTYSHFCGGVIITPTHVLTAAHCITQVASTGDFRVVAGILNLQENHSQRQEVQVVARIVHPSYGGGVGPNDIGILRLGGSLVFNNVVQPASLPVQQEVVLGQAILSGWGSTSNTNVPSYPLHLQTLAVPIVPNVDCNEAIRIVLPNSQNPFSFDSNVCSGPLTGGFSACSGDSGGPLVQNGTIYGLVSWGIIPCGTVGAPTVYTKVENFLAYIRSNVPDLPQ